MREIDKIQRSSKVVDGKIRWNGNKERIYDKIVTFKQIPNFGWLECLVRIVKVVCPVASFPPRPRFGPWSTNRVSQSWQPPAQKQKRYVIYSSSTCSEDNQLSQDLATQIRTLVLGGTNHRSRYSQLQHQCHTSVYSSADGDGVGANWYVATSLHVSYKISDTRYRKFSQRSRSIRETCRQNSNQFRWCTVTG